MSKIPSVLWTCNQGLKTGEKATARANIDAAEALTAAQLAACNSGITSSKVTSYDDHVADTTIHVTSSDKTTWNGKQDALSTAQLDACNSGITSSKVSSYDTHVADTTIHVTTSDKTTWNGKQDALSTTQMDACNSGINSVKVATYDTHVADTTIHVTTSDKTAWNNKYDLPSGGIPSTDLSSGVQSSLGLAETSVQGVRFQDKTVNLPKSNGIVSIPFADYRHISGDNYEEDLFADGVLSGQDKKKLDTILSFSTVSAGGTPLSASEYNSTLYVTGGGGVSVSIDNGNLKIQSDTINDGLLKFKLNDEGSGTSTGFTANSQNGATFNIPAASYDTSTNPTTYRAGVMTGQDKELLNNHYHGFITNAGCIDTTGANNISDYSIYPGAGDALMVAYSTRYSSDKGPYAINYSRLTFAADRDTGIRRSVLCRRGSWDAFQPDMSLTQTMWMGPSQTLSLNNADIIYNNWYNEITNDSGVTYREPQYTYFYDITESAATSYITAKVIPVLAQYMYCYKSETNPEYSGPLNTSSYGVEYNPDCFWVYEYVCNNIYEASSNTHRIESHKNTTKYLSTSSSEWYDVIRRRSAYGICVIEAIYSGISASFDIRDGYGNQLYTAWTTYPTTSFVNVLNKMLEYTSDITIIRTSSTASNSNEDLELTVNLNDLDHIVTRFNLHLLHQFPVVGVSNHKHTNIAWNRGSNTNIAIYNGRGGKITQGTSVYTNLRHFGGQGTDIAGLATEIDYVCKQYPGAVDSPTTYTILVYEHDA